MVRVGSAIFGDADLRPAGVLKGSRTHEGHSARFAAAAIQHRDARLRPRRGARHSSPRWPTTTRTRSREADRLRQEVAKLEAVLAEHRGQERNLRNTLLTAQKMADEIKDGATAEAERIITRGRSAAPTSSSRSPRPASRTSSARSKACASKRREVEKRRRGADLLAAGHAGLHQGAGRQGARREGAAAASAEAGRGARRAARGPGESRSRTSAPPRRDSRPSVTLRARRPRRASRVEGRRRGLRGTGPSSSARRGAGGRRRQRGADRDIGPRPGYSPARRHHHRRRHLPHQARARGRAVARSRRC